MGAKSRKTHEEFIEEMKIKNPSVKVLGKYIGCKTKIEVKCAKCEHVWFSQPTNLLQGFGCPECARIHSGDYHKRNRNDFIIEIKNINPDLEVLGEYINARTGIHVRCKKCGHEWNPVPDVLINRRATCINCKKAGTSYIEQFLLEVFRQVFGVNQVVSRTKSAIGMELDIYIPEHKLAIEYGSWYWHRRNLKRDIEKRNRCINKGIRLINIYDAIGDDNPPFEEDCYTFVKPLSLSTIDILNKLMEDLLLNDLKIYEHINWELAIANSVKNVNIDKSNEFKKKLFIINPNIEVLDAYKGYDSKIQCRCKVCGYIWNASPSNLLGNKGKCGTSCPKCMNQVKSDKLSKDAKQFTDELKKVNPNIIQIDEYKRSNIKIAVKCRNCNYEWYAVPQKLLQNRGCPKCKKVYKRTETDFQKELEQISPTITIIGKYVNTETKIRVQCKKCLNIWESTPASLLGKKGRKPSECPVCVARRRALASRKTNEQFVNELRQVNPNVIPLEKYETTHKKILVRCLLCENEWHVTPAHLLSGQKCPKRRSHNVEQR